MGDRRPSIRTAGWDRPGLRLRGVPLTNPLVREAMRLGISVSNDLQIFLEIVPCKVIGITGSAGKTTTTTLVGLIALASGLFRKVWVGGNIGLPLIAFVDEMSVDDLVVMELSSFQLEIMSRSPEIAAVLNVTPNHLDRHGDMDVYLQAKARILDFQSTSGIAILGRDDPGANSLASHVQGRLMSFGLAELPDNQEGSYYLDRGLFLRFTGRTDRKVMERSDILLRGEHNLLNVLAACTICAAAGIPSEAMKAAVVDFKGVSHRLEFVRSWGEQIGITIRSLLLQNGQWPQSVHLMILWSCWSVGEIKIYPGKTLPGWPTGE